MLLSPSNTEDIPSKMFLIVPLGLLHIDFNPNSFTLPSSAKKKRKYHQEDTKKASSKENNTAYVLQMNGHHGPGVIVAHLIATLYLQTEKWFNRYISLMSHRERVI